MEHTKTPWEARFEVGEETFDRGWRIYGPDADKFVANCGWGGNAEKCARFIVQACNSFAALVEALTWVQDEAKKSEAIDCGDHCSNKCMWCAVDAALDLARK